MPLTMPNVADPHRVGVAIETPYIWIAKTEFHWGEGWARIELWCHADAEAADTWGSGGPAEARVPPIWRRTLFLGPEGRLEVIDPDTGGPVAAESPGFWAMVGANQAVYEQLAGVLYALAASQWHLFPGAAPYP